MIPSLILSLLLTLAIELPVAWLWGLRGRDLQLAALVNLLTNPPVVLLAILLPRPPVVAVLELAAVAAEAFCYLRRGEQIRHPVLLACVANLISYSAGILIQLLQRRIFP